MMKLEFDTTEISGGENYNPKVKLVIDHGVLQAKLVDTNGFTIAHLFSLTERGLLVFKRARSFVEREGFSWPFQEPSLDGGVSVTRA